MIKITADSTCDLSPELLAKYDISLAPLHVLIDEDDYLDGVNITPKDIFHYVSVENKTCTTAAINTFEYEQFFEPFTKQYDAIIHMNIGSAFSSCHQNARLAAQNFDNIIVIDSKNPTDKPRDNAEAINICEVSSLVLLLCLLWETNFLCRFW